FGHLAYEVDDIYAACDKLMRDGVTSNRPPRDGHMAFIRSPDNISIELLQKGKPLPKAEPWASMQNSGKWSVWPLAVSARRKRKEPAARAVQPALRMTRCCDLRAVPHRTDGDAAEGLPTQGTIAVTVTQIAVTVIIATAAMVVIMLVVVVLV